MLYQIPSFLLDVITGLFGGACLLRLYMQYHRVPFGNPLGRFIFAITDWIVLPLRRIVPSFRRWDLASAIAAWLLVMVSQASMGGRPRQPLWGQVDRGTRGRRRRLRARQPRIRGSCRRP